MTGEYFQKNAKCKRVCSLISNSAWCDLNGNGNTLKLHDNCLNGKCKCQKQITFSPRQFQLECSGFRSILKKIFKATEKAWNNFLKPAVIVAAPFIGMAVSAKTKNPKVGQATTNILKSIPGGKNLNLTDMHGNGFRLKVMKIISNNLYNKMSSFIKDLFEYD